MDSPLTVSFFDLQREYHRITFPPTLNIEDLFADVKKQICDMLGVKELEMFSGEDDGDIVDSEDPPMRPLSCPEDLDVAIRNLLNYGENHLEIFFEPNPPPVLSCRDQCFRVERIKERKRDENGKWIKPKVLTHEGIVCDGCEQKDFGGLRYKCLRCYDFDLCYNCYMADRFSEETHKHDRYHPMRCIDMYFTDDKYLTHSTCTTKVVACIYCEEKGFSPIDFYEHIKIYHNANVKNVTKPLKGMNLSEEMLAELSTDLKQRKADIEKKEADFERRIFRMMQKEEDFAREQAASRAAFEETQRTAAALEEKMKALEDREKELAIIEVELREREKTYEKKGTKFEAMKALKTEISLAKCALFGKKLGVEKREKMVERREWRMKGLEDREKTLEDKEKDLSKREEDLSRRETRLKMEAIDVILKNVSRAEKHKGNVLGQRDLAEWQKELDEEENDLSQREKVVEQREKGLDTRETVVKEKEWTLMGRERAVAEREEKVAALEAKEVDDQEKAEESRNTNMNEAEKAWWMAMLSPNLQPLYPRVELKTLELPTHLNGEDKGSFLFLTYSTHSPDTRLIFPSIDGSSCAGLRIRLSNPTAVRADRPCPLSVPIYYFEVLVTESSGMMGVGLSTKDMQLTRLPGWDAQSYGYHGDDGCFFTASGQGVKYGPTYGSGDIIGCGLNTVQKTVFFTKNGLNLGDAKVIIDSLEGLYPTVGLMSRGSAAPSVDVNFGQMPFVYNVAQHIKAIEQWRIELARKSLEALMSRVPASTPEDSKNEDEAVEDGTDDEDDIEKGEKKEEEMENETEISDVEKDEENQHEDEDDDEAEDEIDEEDEEEDETHSADVEKDDEDDEDEVDDEDEDEEETEEETGDGESEEDTEEPEDIEEKEDSRVEEEEEEEKEPEEQDIALFTALTEGKFPAQSVSAKYDARRRAKAALQEANYDVYDAVFEREEKMRKMVASMNVPFDYKYGPDIRLLKKGVDLVMIKTGLTRNEALRAVHESTKMDSSDEKVQKDEKALHDNVIVDVVEGINGIDLDESDSDSEESYDIIDLDDDGNLVCIKA